MADNVANVTAEKEDVDGVVLPLSDDPKRVVVIVGPTGVGKSAAALALADLIGGPVEQISCDSVQVYEGLDIGSNKPSTSEQQRCRIHLVDWVHPTVPCNAAAWVDKAVELIADMHDRGVSPIVVGGSCMYADWLLHHDRHAHSGQKRDPIVRAGVAAKLKPFQERADWQGGLSLLQELSPERAARLTPNDWRRLAIHLEATCSEGVTADSDNVRPSRRLNIDFRAFFLCPADRQKLCHTIDARCVLMLQAGLLQEVAQLFVSGALQFGTPAADAIGYRQALDYLLRPDPKSNDVPSFQAFLRTFCTVSRNYARKQSEWFLKDTSVMWIPADPANPQTVASQILEYAIADRAYFDCALHKDSGVRAAQLAQGPEMACFRSEIDFLPKTLLEEMVAVADCCTWRIPNRERRESRPIVSATVSHVEAQSIAEHTHVFARVYWAGRHKTWGWGNPLGKLHKAGMQLVESFGWQRTSEDNHNYVPVFCWPVRGAGDFPASGEACLPLIRPFPQSFSDLLDNKASLARLLSAGGRSAIHPETWSATGFLEERPAGDITDVFFLKHNMGVKGNAVHPYTGTSGLIERLGSMPPRNRENFIVQRGVSPPALRNGRKWVLRAHVLLHATTHGAEEQYSAFCHRDVIRLEHGHLYEEGSSKKAAHVSNAGLAKHWPTPDLLNHTTEECLFRQVLSLSTQMLAAIWHTRPRGPFSPRGAHLCQIFGLDIATDATGRAWLLEVNSYPAIAGGTMQHVEVSVYTTLVRDVLHLVVLPHINDDAVLEPKLGGFVRLNVEDSITN